MLLFISLRANHERSGHKASRLAARMVASRNGNFAASLEETRRVLELDGKVFERWTVVGDRSSRGRIVRSVCGAQLESLANDIVGIYVACLGSDGLKYHHHTIGCISWNT